MKKTCMAACLAISLGFCSTAMAKDIDAVDVFAGNSLSAIAYADISSLVNSKIINDAMDATGSNKNGSVMAGLDELAKLGIDYKKDIKSAVIAVDVDMHSCMVIDASKSVKALWDKEMTREGSSVTAYGNYQIVNENGANGVLLSDKRVLICEGAFNIQTVLDNVAKPKALKSTDKVLYTAYSQTSAKADIRVAGKMIDSLRGDAAKARIKDGNIVVSAADAESISVSLDFKKGISLDARALGKSDKIAADAAAILNMKVAPFLSDPSLGEMGLGFLPSVVKIASSKKYLTVNVDMNDDQVTSIVALLAVMAGAK